MLSLQTSFDDFHFHGRELYWLSRRRQGESTISNVVLERAIGGRSTVRGVATVQRIAARRWPPPASGDVDLATATIGQLLIPVTDLDRAIGYYRDSLGLPLLFAAPPQMSFFQAGDVRLLVGVAHRATPGCAARPSISGWPTSRPSTLTLSARGGPVQRRAPASCIGRRRVDVRLAEFDPTAIISP